MGCALGDYKIELIVAHNGSSTDIKPTLGLNLASS
jgi:hypothetical protein